MCLKFFSTHRDCNKKLSYRRGTARRTMSVEILLAAAHPYEKNQTWKRMPYVIALKVTQGHRNCRYLIGNMSFPIRGLQ